jgi:hypothetical protein
MLTSISLMPTLKNAPINEFKISQKNSRLFYSHIFLFKTNFGVVLPILQTLNKTVHFQTLSKK